MPARNGQQYIERLRERPPALYLRGERVKDATAHPGLSGGVKTVARLYDLQHGLRPHPDALTLTLSRGEREQKGGEGNEGVEMTYASPGSGEPVGLSFITPKSASDLELRRGMMRRWAQVSCGMMGRTPDFLNVSLMAMAAARGLFCGGQGGVRGKHQAVLRVGA